MRDRFGEEDKQHIQLARAFEMHGTLHPCCCKAENLQAPEVDPESGSTFRRCRICHARHHVTTLAPGRVGGLAPRR